MIKEKIQFDFWFLENKKNPLTWWTTKLNERISPIEKHHYIIFWWESWSWKTAFTFDMAIKNAKLWHRTVYISLEMNWEEIIKRIWRNTSQMTKAQVRTWEYTETQKQTFIDKCNEINDLENFFPIWFESWEDPTVDAIFDKIMKYDADLIILDNFDKIQSSEEWMNTLQSQEYISKELMNFTNKIKVPIILIHHFKKWSWKKEARWLDDLRWSWKLSHDADSVIIWSRNSWDDLDEFEKSQFMISQIKDRDFWEWWFSTVYFNKWTFNDETHLMSKKQHLLKL